MATMLPPQPPPGTSRPEVRAFISLSGMPADWTIYHSVPWIGEKREGEGDFVVVSPVGGFIFIEVKSRCDVDENGQWTRHNSSMIIKDPWEQAKVTGREVMARLKKAGVSRRPAAHVACFPAGEPHFAGGLAMQQQRSISAAVLADPRRLLSILESALAEAAARDPVPLTKFTAPELENIRSVLLVTGQIHVPARMAIAHAEEDRAHLTGEQIKTYVDLMSASRMLTVGGAGTGKTLLAAARAAELTRQGLSTVVVTAHRLLSQRIEFLIAQNGGRTESVRVLSLTELATEVAEAPDLDELLDEDFWLQSLPRAQLRAEALIVDDAQHLTPHVVAALTILLSDPTQGSIYLFADPDQTTHSSWLLELQALLPMGITAKLRHNCRNTSQICTLVARLVGKSEVSDIQGPDVRLILTETRQEAVRRAREVAVSFLAEDGLSADSVAVLYDGLSWYPYLWKREVVDASDDARGQGSADYYDGSDNLWSQLDAADRFWYSPAVELDTSIGAESDGSAVGFGGYTYYLRRRSALEIVLRNGRKGAVRCLHLESAIGLEFEAVILLLDASTLNELDLEEIAGVDGFGDKLVLLDDDGFDAGVWLKSLSGSDARTARAYVGCTRARTLLTVIGCDEALALFRS